MSDKQPETVKNAALDFEKRMERADFYEKYEEAFHILYDHSMNGERFGNKINDE